MGLKTLSAILLLLLGADLEPITVNSLEDTLNPPQGIVTLRSALNQAASGQTIIFDQTLDGKTIELTHVGEEHTTLKGEVMDFIDGISVLIGYFDRDYGRSALFAKKNVILDASALSGGVTLKWANDTLAARVLAVYGDLTLKNVRITGGRSETADISETNEDQPWTLARGGGVAVWGRATIVDCEIYHNHCAGDFDQSRDRGAFGGGVYADIVDIRNSIISGNTVLGAGAAGGGVYSVGGAGSSLTTSRVDQSAITGNKISALFTYGGGVYSDGGGIGNLKYLELANSTIARNLVEPVALPPRLWSLYNIGYWRAGGVYMSNGYLTIQSCTIVENETHGYPRTDDLGKPNLAGGIASTIGNAHAVEDMVISHSIVAGNTVTEFDFDPNTNDRVYDHDIFSGSLLHFKSGGYNRIGVIDFSQILVPVGQYGWRSLSRRHYPQNGDEDGVSLDTVVDVAGVTRSSHIESSGTDASEPAVLYYQPKADAMNKIPPQPYSIANTYFDYYLSDTENDFLEIILGRIEDHYDLDKPEPEQGFAATFTNDFENYLQNIVDTDPDTSGLQPYLDPDGNPIDTLAKTQWFGPAYTWPSNKVNFAYIDFWHRLDVALEIEAIEGMGPELLGDAAWQALFSEGPLTENEDIYMRKRSDSLQITLPATDQLGNPRPVAASGDIGAIEEQSP